MYTHFSGRCHLSTALNVTPLESVAMLGCEKAEALIEYHAVSYRTSASGALWLRIMIDPVHR